LYPGLDCLLVTPHDHRLRAASTSAMTTWRQLLCSHQPSRSFVTSPKKLSLPRPQWKHASPALLGAGAGSLLLLAGAAGGGDC
jgi:hypothetical protein